MARIVAQTNVKHSASVIFLHGSGDTGHGVYQWVRTLLGNDGAFPHIRTVYPTAPLRPYTPIMGQRMNVWFDRVRIAPTAPEHIESTDAMCTELEKLIDNEIENGVSENRIVVGGFSMGGAMALHLAYRKRPGLAGVFALSGFLNHESSVYDCLQSRDSDTELPPLFQCHGQKDNLVLYNWGVNTHQRLKELGVSNSQFHTFPNLFHEMNTEEVLMLRNWIEERLPEKQ